MSERTRAKERSEWGGWRMVEGEDGGGVQRRVVGW
jgi:hypothetical protein